MKGGGAIRSGDGGGGSLMRTLLRLPVVLLSCSLFVLAGFLSSLLFTQDRQGEEDLERPLRREPVMEAVWPEMAYRESGNPAPSLIPYQVPKLTAAAGYFFRDGAEGKRTYPLYACRAGNDADDAKNRHPHVAKPEGVGTMRDEIPNPPEPEPEPPPTRSAVTPEVANTAAARVLPDGGGNGEEHWLAEGIAGVQQNAFYMHHALISTVPPLPLLLHWLQVLCRRGAGGDRAAGAVRQQMGKDRHLRTG